MDEQKKTFAIVTLSASDNCGSLLQAYALQELVKECGKAAVEIIHFSTRQSHQLYDIFPENILSDRKKLWDRIKHYKSLKKQKKAYNDFRKQFLILSAGEEIFPEDIEAMAKKYCVVIVGSDQVWNVMMSDYDDTFFLPQINCKKIAYAPSLGGHDLEEAENYNDIVKWLEGFSAISVREKKGKKCLEKATGRDVEIVLDPTLVLDQMAWKKLVGERIIKKRYIFYYSWAYNEPDLNNIVYYESKRSKYPVYVIDALKWTDKNVKKWGFTLCAEAGPLTFLNLMYYAEKCYVQSFHGMIFAYMFQKNFWLLDSHDKLESLDTRLAELLGQIKMENRLLTPFNYDSIDKEALPDYAYNFDLEEMKRQSINYLRVALDDGEL